MKIGSKTLVFLMTLLIFIVSISVVSAVDTNINSTDDVQLSEQTQQISDTTIVDNSDTIEENDIKELKTTKDETRNLLKEGNTHTVTSANIRDILNSASDGDTLDLEGTFKNSITISKPLNIISTSGDAFICNTTFTVDEGGSYSNITGLSFYNTKIVVTKASYVTIDHITDVVKNSNIGSGTGHLAIRTSSYITLNNSYIYTEESGGSSSVVFTVADHCIMNNCTVKGVGNVGNLIYINAINADDNIFTPQALQRNIENLISNNVILGPDTATSICYGVQVTGVNNTITGNILNYSGTGINAGSKGTATNNILYGGCSVSATNSENNVEYSEPLTDLSVLPSPLESKITLNEINPVDLGETIYLSGKLTDNSNKAIPISYIRDSNAAITWTIEETGEEGTIELNNDGTFEFDVTPETSGTFNLIINVDPIYNGFYSESETTAQLSVVDSRPVHVVTQSTYQNFFGDDGLLTDIVNDGDTLDFQGTINITGQDFIINRPVNIISSTHDAYVRLNSGGGSLTNDKPPADIFQIVTGAEYTNISDIYFFNTQLWVFNTSHITFDNVSAVVSNKSIGSGIGQTAIRGSSYVTFKNGLISTENNGGSSSFVLTLSHHCVLDNCTVQGIGNVGNMVSTNAANLGNLTMTTEANQNNNYTNNRIIGPTTALSICYLLVPGGNSTVVGNTFIYNGTGMSSAGTLVANNTCIGGCGLNGKEFYNNTLNGGSITVAADGYLSDVECGALTVNKNAKAENVVCTGLTVSSSSATKTTINNVTVNGATSISTKATNVIIENSTLNGAVNFVQNSGNNTISNCNITGTVKLPRNTNINNTITNNIIITNSTYTIDSSGVNNTITGNALFAKTTSGDNSIKTAGNDIIHSNTPSTTSIELDDISDATVNDIITINGVLKNKDAIGIKENITISLPDEENERTIETNNDGTFQTTYTPTTPGTQTITVTFNDKIVNGLTYYYGSEDTKTITVNEIFTEPKNTVIELDSIEDVLVNQPITISGVLKKEDDGVGLNGNITISLPDEENERTIETNNDGTFQTTYTPTTLGTQTITVKFNNKTINGMLYYIESSNSITINVKTLNLVLDEIEDGTVNEPTTITGSLTMGDKALAGENISLIISFEDDESAPTPVEPSFYDASNWQGNPSISGTNIQTSGANIAYYTEYTAKELNNIECTVVIAYPILNYGFYNPTAKDWINLGSLITTTSVPITITHDDENIYATTKSTTTISLESKDLSNYYLAMQTPRPINPPQGNPYVRMTNLTGTAIGSGPNISTVTISDVIIEEDGTFSAQYTPEKATEYTVTAIYNGSADGKYYPINSTSQTFNVIEKYETTIEIDDIESIIINEAVTVTGTLKDEDGTGIKASITITLPDEETTIETEDDGTFTYTSETTFDTAGDYTVTITYEGNNTLIGTDSSATFTVKGPKNTVIEIDDIENITVNKKVTITGTLTDEDGTGIKAYITITLPDEETTIETEDDGTFTFTSESTFAKGEYTVTITYEGNEDELLIGTSASKSFTVTKINTIITLDPINANVNDEVTLTARVTDVDGNAVNGGKLIFKVNGVTVRDESGSVLTAIVENGVASVDTIISKTWTTGSSVEAVYAGTTNEYNSVRFTDDTVFTISKAVVDVAVSLNKTSVVAGETIEITATITYNGQLVNNGRIIIKVNGITVKGENQKTVYVTVVNGVAKFNYTVPENWKIGDKTIVVIYDNSAYNKSEGSTDFSIVKDDVTIDITPVVTTKNNPETQITAQIKNSFNHPITGTTKVSIKVNGITLKIITVTDGIINTTIDTSSLTKTDYTLTFVIGENSRYNSARQTTTLKIE